MNYSIKTMANAVLLDQIYSYKAHMEIKLEIL